MWANLIILLLGIGNIGAYFGTNPDATSSEENTKILSYNVRLFNRYEWLENTIFIVDQIGRSNFTIPYLDGSLSISRASRTFPQYLIFKPA